MALLVTISGPPALADVYDDVIKELVDQGLGNPSGRRSHVAGIDAAGITVADVWENEKAFGAFAEQLVPIIAKLGGPEPVVRVLPVRNSFP